jgi:hypothetical protein
LINQINCQTSSLRSISKVCRFGIRTPNLDWHSSLRASSSSYLVLCENAKVRVIVKSLKNLVSHSFHLSCGALENVMHKSPVKFVKLYATGLQGRNINMRGTSKTWQLGNSLEQNLFEKQIVKKYPAIYGIHRPITTSPVTENCLEPDESSSHPYTLVSLIPILISCHLRLGHPRCLFGFSDKLCMRLSSHSFYMLTHLIDFRVPFAFRKMLASTVRVAVTCQIPYLEDHPLSAGGSKDL